MGELHAQALCNKRREGDVRAPFAALELSASFCDSRNMLESGRQKRPDVWRSRVSGCAGRVAVEPAVTTKLRPLVTPPGLES
ncbi:hypothetical protein RB195_006669 [Necator americanus]|uniref:Uncharacterized protein n=1 Tax=Necator americanus TaxID=51031 RepID=A0ABR1BTP1_NECAM